MTALGEALRQQLEAALERFRLTGSADLVYAVVAAARVATATEIAEALDKLKRTTYAHHASASLALDEAMDLVRSVGGSAPAPQKKRRPMSDDRDRVTAILTLYQAAIPENMDDPSMANIRAHVKLRDLAPSEAPWLALRLLEALDAIDRLETRVEVLKSAALQGRSCDE